MVPIGYKTCWGVRPLFCSYLLSWPDPPLSYLLSCPVCPPLGCLAPSEAGGAVLTCTHQSLSASVPACSSPLTLFLFSSSFFCVAPGAAPLLFIHPKHCRGTPACVRMHPYGPSSCLISFSELTSAWHDFLPPSFSPQLCLCVCCPARLFTCHHLDCSSSCVFVWRPPSGVFLVQPNLPFCPPFQSFVLIRFRRSLVYGGRDKISRWNGSRWASLSNGVVMWHEKTYPALFFICLFRGRLCFWYLCLQSGSIWPNLPLKTPQRLKSDWN